MPDKPIVLLTNAMHPDGEAILAPHVKMIVPPDARPETLRQWAKDADGIIVRAKLPDDIVDHAPRLKGMVRHGVGLDFIPVAAATARGIAVANLPGSNTNAVAEYVMSALMHLRRPLYQPGQQFAQQGLECRAPGGGRLHRARHDNARHPRRRHDRPPPREYRARRFRDESARHLPPQGIAACRYRGSLACKTCSPAAMPSRCAAR